MKKLLSCFFMLIMVSSLTLIASAAKINVSVSSANINAGDTIIVTIALNEAINVSEGATMMQGDLVYDGSVLELQSIQKNARLTQAAKHTKLDKVLFYYLSMDNTAVGFEAGTLATIKFTAREDIAENGVKTNLGFTAYVQNTKGENVGDLTYTESVTITVSKAPITDAPTTEAPTTEVPTTETPTPEAPTTEEPTTEAPTTEAPTTEEPTTEAPTTEAPTTEAPASDEPDDPVDPEPETPVPSDSPKTGDDGVRVYVFSVMISMLVMLIVYFSAKKEIE